MRPITGLAAAILLALLSLAAPSARVAACSCMEMTPQQAFDSAEVVFVGSAVGVAEPDPHDELEQLRYRFVVEEARKGLGSHDRELVISTPRDGAMCGASLEVGTRYLVHAGSMDGLLGTSLCSGNQALGPGLVATDGDDPPSGEPWPMGALAAGLAVLALAVGSGLIFLRR